MRVLIKRCPKCGGTLFLDHEQGEAHGLPPEWTCLQCGWNRPAALLRSGTGKAVRPEPCTICGGSDHLTRHHHHCRICDSERHNTAKHPVHYFARRRAKYGDRV
jgi:ribosomal protein S27AE